MNCILVTRSVLDQCFSSQLLKKMCAYLTTVVVCVVPEQVTVLTSSIIQRDSVRLEWAQPPKSNGILTGYLLQYHLSM